MLAHVRLKGCVGARASWRSGYIWLHKVTELLRGAVTYGYGASSRSGACYADAEKGEDFDEAPEARHVVGPQEDDELGARGEEDGQTLERGLDVVPVKARLAEDVAGVANVADGTSAASEGW